MDKLAVSQPIQPVQDKQADTMQPLTQALHGSLPLVETKRIVAIEATTETKTADLVALSAPIVATSQVESTAAADVSAICSQLVHNVLAAVVEEIPLQTQHESKSADATAENKSAVSDSANNNVTTEELSAAEQAETDRLCKSLVQQMIDNVLNSVENKTVTTAETAVSEKQTENKHVSEETLSKTEKEHENTEQSNPNIAVTTEITSTVNVEAKSEAATVPCCRVSKKYSLFGFKFGQRSEAGSITITSNAIVFTAADGTITELPLNDSSTVQVRNSCLLGLKIKTGSKRMKINFTDRSSLAAVQGSLSKHMC
jgi:hypothetical protein